MSIEEDMRSRVEEKLSPSFLEIKNQSHLHAGHAGDDGSGASHFLIKISSPKFETMSRIDRERAVHIALGDIMQKIHALTVKIIQ